MKTLTRIAAGAAALGLVAGPTVALAEDAKSQSMTIDQYNAQGGQVASFDDAAAAESAGLSVEWIIIGGVVVGAIVAGAVFSFTSSDDT